MNGPFQKILVIQTAFIGDVILTLPLIQVLKRNFQDAQIDVVATPQASGLFINHPAIGRVIAFDKRGVDSGIGGFRRLKNEIAEEHYELAVIPHRSLRSALLALLSRIPIRVGFNNSAGKWMFTHVVRYRSDKHEVERNLSLLGALGIQTADRELPSLYPCEEDRKAIDLLLRQSGTNGARTILAMAPGTIWNTKRWPKERFAELARKLGEEGCSVVLIGSGEDRSLCDEIQQLAASRYVLNTAGRLSLLQSAELIRRSGLIVSNDSAPMHMGVAVRTPVIAVFGATVPAFGFSPYGDRDVIVETLGLKCRPCSIHGGDSCPIKTFDCMMNIDAARVLHLVHETLSHTH